MKAVFEKTAEIAPSRCDADGRLGYPNAFSLFMDMAALHAETLGVGFQAMKNRGLYWLTAKTRIEFIDRPLIDEAVTVRTWPERPEKVRCNRSYELLRGNDVLVRGKTEWVVFDTSVRRPVPAVGVFPEDLEYPDRSAFNEPFTRIPDLFKDVLPYAEYCVLSTDIDIGGHMNNASYLRVLFGTLSNEEIRSMKIRSVEAVFRTPCYEKDLMSFKRAAFEDGWAFSVESGGQTVFLCLIR